jgi:hypothetical protein
MSKLDDNHSQEPYIVSFAHYFKNEFGNGLKSVGTVIKNDPAPVPTNDAQKDYDSIVKLILDFEIAYDTGKNLTLAAIKRYQSRLDKISEQYHYDSSLDGLYCAFYELQALIYKTQSNDQAAIKFLAEASDLKPKSQSFISAAAQKWYAEELEPAANKYPSIRQRTYRKKHLFTNKEFIILSIIVLGAAFGIGFGPVSDYFTIRDANPAMVKLAQQAGMSRQGEVLFLRTNPQIDSDTQFPNDCSTASSNSNGESVLGCYVSSTNRIYILQMPNDLYDEEVSTAAYEMLHPVYDDLLQSGSNNVNQAIESAYSAVESDPSSCTDDISSMVGVFAKTEPGARDNELFSLLGTECDNLPSDLLSYYSPYFANIYDDVADNQQVSDLLQNDLTQINQLNTTINQLNSKIATDLYDTESWDGINESEFNYDYNIYSQNIDTANNDIDQYNQLVNQYNSVNIALNGGQPVSQIQNVQSQSQ